MNCRVLLVGVEHHPNHPKHGLWGCHQDVVNWNMVLRRAGVPDGRIRVLMSPRGGATLSQEWSRLAGGPPPASLDMATLANVNAGLRWLTEGCEAGLKPVLVFCGHSFFHPQDDPNYGELSLAALDVDLSNHAASNPLPGALTLRMLGGSVTAWSKAGQRATVVLDTCGLLANNHPLQNPATRSLDGALPDREDLNALPQLIQRELQRPRVDTPWKALAVLRRQWWYPEETSDGDGGGLTFSEQDVAKSLKSHVEIERLYDSAARRERSYFFGNGSLAPQVLWATEPRSPAFEVQVGRTWNGVMSWAATSVAGRWRKGVTDQEHYLKISWGELTRRTTDVIEAMEIGQQPTHSGVAALAVLAQAKPMPKSDPRPLVHRQISGGTSGIRELEIWADPGDGSPSVNVGVVFAVADANIPTAKAPPLTWGPDFRSGREYWKISNSLALTTAVSITLKPKPHRPFTTFAMKPTFPTEPYFESDGFDGGDASNYAATTKTFVHRNGLDTLYLTFDHSTGGKNYLLFAYHKTKNLEEVQLYRGIADTAFSAQPPTVFSKVTLPFTLPATHTVILDPEIP